MTIKIDWLKTAEGEWYGLWGGYRAVVRRGALYSWSVSHNSKWIGAGGVSSQEVAQRAAEIKIDGHRKARRAALTTADHGSKT